MAGFEIIPVLDLMGGQVVQAQGGRRDAYRPIQTPLAEGSAPKAVLRGLLGLHPFASAYIADLDAIGKTGEHIAPIRALARAFPAVTFWVDAGFTHACTCRKILEAGLGRPVLGSESQEGTGTLESLRDEPGLVLSLDFKGAARLGPEAIFEDPALWPERVIVMTLAAVGGGRGPDLARLREVLARADGRAVYAAGGVRDGRDLDLLAGMGCAGVLVATALHDGRLGRADLARFG